MDYRAKNTLPKFDHRYKSNQKRKCGRWMLPSSKLILLNVQLHVPLELLYIKYRNRLISYHTCLKISVLSIQFNLPILYVADSRRQWSLSLITWPHYNYVSESDPHIERTNKAIRQFLWIIQFSFLLNCTNVRHVSAWTWSGPCASRLTFNY